MRKTRIIATAAAITIALTTTNASDFGVWSGAEVSKKLGDFSLALDAGMRTQNGISNIDRWSVGFGVDYKPAKFLTIGTSYNYLYNYKAETKKAHYDHWLEKDENDNLVSVSEYDGYNINKPYWQSRNRWNFDVTGKLPIGRFTLSLRERYQFTRSISTTSIDDKYRILTQGTEPVYKETEPDFHKAKNTSRLRSRLKAEYDIRKCPVAPYAYVEFHNNLRENLHNVKTRMGLGAEIKINKQNRIDIGYIYQDSRDNDEGDGKLHVVDISYKFKF